MFPACDSGVETISNAIGDNISILIQWNSTFVAAIVVGFVREYRLALLLLAVIPFMALAGYFVGKVRSILFLFLTPQGIPLTLIRWVVSFLAWSKRIMPWQGAWHRKC